LKQIINKHLIFFKTFKIKKKVHLVIKNFIEKQEMILVVYTGEELRQYSNESHSLFKLLQNGCHSQRSGDILFINKPDCQDSQLELLLYMVHFFHMILMFLYYGKVKNIKGGNTVRRVDISSITPTFSFICGVMIPNGSFENSLIELFE